MAVASPLKPPRFLGSIHQLFELRKYVRSSGLRTCPYFSNRFQLYEHVHAKLVGNDPIDYLEFGVFQGTSIRKWASLNPHPGSRFFGFDTFEGLPEPWVFSTGELPANYFSTEGKPPDIPDARVHFIKGLFQDTFADFLTGFQAQNRLVIHCDADLYSSTLYVLATVDDIVRPGTIVLFDEFGSVTNEFRAFVDYTSSFRRKLSPLGWAGRFYEHVAFVVGE